MAIRKLFPCFLALVLAAALPAQEQLPIFTVGWSAGVGWNPYSYMNGSGLLKRWGDKYGISIRAPRFDYAASVDAFVGRKLDAVTITNMEALDRPAAAGIDTTVIILGDYSNGAHALLARNGVTLKTLAGKRLMLAEKTVSQYLFERAMVVNELQSQIGKVKLVSISDSEIAAAFINDPSQEAVVTRRPYASRIANTTGVSKLFDSSQIPGEILDFLVIRTDVLNTEAGQNFAKAITGAWYEVMDQMSKGPNRDGTLQAIASASQDTLEFYKEQLSATRMMYTPKEAIDLAGTPQFKEKMSLMRLFCFTHGLLGTSTKTVDEIAIRYPDGSIQGRKDRVRLRFDLNFMQLAAQGKL